uniref:Flavin-containing monooxygenase FMO GS-OX3 n=1 Tax=Aegilops tauschii TaxID=37682 RepID=M8BVI2_AEGTA
MAIGDGEPVLQFKSVCVVGGGMAGLAVARELRREGHTVTVMEQSGDVGGQWLYDRRTDVEDPMGAVAPVRVPSSIYACLRLISPREVMGCSDFQFLPREGAGRDPRRYPGHRELHCYLRDFCHVFGIMETVRLNTRVLRVAPAAMSMSTTTRRWAVRSVRRLGGTEDDDGNIYILNSTVPVGVPRRVLIPWFFEVQARWVAQVLSGRHALPSEEQMLRSVEEQLRAREAAGVPRKHTHNIASVEPRDMYEFGGKYCDFTPTEEWKKELILSSNASMDDDVETFRNRADGDSENVRKGRQGWLGGLVAQAQEETAVKTEF